VIRGGGLKLMEKERTRLVTERRLWARKGRDKDARGKELGAGLRAADGEISASMDYQAATCRQVTVTAKGTAIQRSKKAKP